METPSALVTDLRTLGEALDPPREDLEAILHELIARIRITTASYPGLTVSIVNDGTTFTISTLTEDEGRSPVRSSASIPLTTNAISLGAAAPGVVRGIRQAGGAGTGIG